MSQTPPPTSTLEPMSPDEERNWAMIAHLSGLVLLVIGPLIIMLVFGARSTFVRKQAAEALNFQIVIAIGLIISLILTVVVIGAILLPIIVIVGVIFMILGGVAANKGVEYRYPFNLRMVN